MKKILFYSVIFLIYYRIFPETSTHYIKDDMNKLIKIDIDINNKKILSYDNEYLKIPEKIYRFSVSPSKKKIFYIIAKEWGEDLYIYNDITQSSHFIYSLRGTEDNSEYFKKSGMNPIGMGLLVGNIHWINDEKIILDTYTNYDGGGWSSNNLILIENNQFKILKNDDQFEWRYNILSEEEYLISNYKNAYLFNIETNNKKELFSFKPVITYSEFNYNPLITKNNDKYYALIPYYDIQIKDSTTLYQYDETIGQQKIEEFENFRWFEYFYSTDKNFLLYRTDNEVKIYDLANSSKISYDKKRNFGIKLYGWNTSKNEFIYSVNNKLYLGTPNTSPKEIYTKYELNIINEIIWDLENYIVLKIDNYIKDSYDYILNDLNGFEYKLQLNDDKSLLSWIYDKKLWLPKNKVLKYSGVEKDSVAWIDKTLKKNVEISFKWEGDFKGKSQPELLLILYGNGKLDETFWNDGFSLNYTIENNQPRSDIRTNGIYDGVKYVATNYHIKKINTNIKHDCLIKIKNNRLSFTINNELIHSNVFINMDKMNGFLGFANYWGSSASFEVTDIVIAELN